MGCLYQVTQNRIPWQGSVALWFKSTTAKSTAHKGKGRFQYSPVTSLEKIHCQAGVAQCRGNQHLKLVLNQLPKAWVQQVPQGLLKPPTKGKGKSCCFEPVVGEMVKYSALSGNTVGEKREFGTVLMTKSKLLYV